jgi:hypothetical protein
MIASGRGGMGDSFDRMNFGESSSIVRDIPSSCLLKTAKVKLDIAMPIFDALGVPRELFLGGVAVKELMSLGQKFKEAQQIRSAAINR